jgi:hypothetical protein
MLDYTNCFAQVREVLMPRGFSEREAPNPAAGRLDTHGTLRAYLYIAGI